MHARHLVVAALTTIIAPAAAAQIACPKSRPLPAYSHNDYENSRPLHGALALGFHGVEADLVLRQGELRVAHSGAESKAGRTMETMYLRPLRAILQECAHGLSSSTALLLNIELKERSQSAYDSLLAVVARYPDVFEAGPSESLAPVEIILVGWSPVLEARTTVERRLGLQYKITAPTSPAAPDQDERVRLISLDYGKTIGWSGKGRVPQHAATWLAGVRRAKGKSGRRLARAYNAPANAPVYRLLLEGGIDLIGTENLEATERVLRQLGRVHSR